MIFMSVSIFSRPVFAQTKPDRETKRAAKIRQSVTRISTTGNGRIIVKTRDGNRLKGSVTEIGEEDFALVEEKSNFTYRIRFGEVKSVKARFSAVRGGYIIASVGLAFLVIYGLVGPN